MDDHITCNSAWQWLCVRIIGVSMCICIINSECTVFDWMNRDQASCEQIYGNCVDHAKQGVLLFVNVQHGSFITYFFFEQGHSLLLYHHTSINAILWNLTSSSARRRLPKSPISGLCTHWGPWLRACHEEKKKKGLVGWLIAGAKHTFRETI